MSLFLCPRACALAVAAVRGATTKSRPATILGLSTSASRWLSFTASRRSRMTDRGHDIWRQRAAAWAMCQSRHSRRTFFSDDRIRDYEQLPKDYRDAVGLAFGSKDLTDAEVQRIFGAGMKTAPANHLLRVLHGRRIAGTLDDPAYAVNTMQFTEGQMGAALAYLRKTVPVEEIRNAGLRAEDELMQMEAEMSRAERAKERSADETDDGEDRSGAKTGAEYKEDAVYGYSTFDQIRATNQARQKARDKALEKERREREESEGIVSGPLAERDQVSGSGRQTRAITNPKIQAYYDAAQSDLAEPPQMTAAARILPSVVVVALVLGVMAAVSTVYEEPAARYRLVPGISTAQATIAAVVGANVLVYLAWKAPPLWKYMNRLFIVTVATPRPVSMLTTMFSHQSLSHLLINMAPLVLLGPALHEELGRARFLTLLVGCGAVGFAGSVATYTLRGMLGTTTLGASGATLGLCAAYFWEHRMDGFKILGLPESGGVHGVVFLALLAAVQLSALGKTLSRKIDVASHLAGMVAGMVGVEVVTRTGTGIQRQGKRVVREGEEGEEGGHQGEGKSVIEVWFWLKPWLRARAQGEDKGRGSGQG